MSENETDLVIDLAKEKGLKEHTSKEHNVVLTDEMNQRTFDAWDDNFDGKISVEEVRRIKKITFFFGKLLKKQITQNVI